MKRKTIGKDVVQNWKERKTNVSSTFCVPSILFGVFILFLFVLRIIGIYSHLLIRKLRPSKFKCSVQRNVIFNSAVKITIMDSFHFYSHTEKIY